MDLALAIALPIAAASSILFFILSLAYFLLHKSHGDSADLELGSHPDTDTGMARDPVHRFKSADIDDFTSMLTTCSVIGEGGFSTVYLASLRTSGVSKPSLAAVKVQNSSQQLHRAFRQELGILLSVRHPNIVRLLGYCDEREEGVLVFEYVPNGTLHDSLRGGGGGLFVLPWPQRAHILFRVALALDYLHEGCELQVVHGDVKPSNVLLDDALVPKLCDFGSGRMGFSATVTRSAIQMMGSFGYTDPHYLRTGLVSKKSDVYSFGVLILETVTGIEAFDPTKEQLLTTVMRPALRADAEGRARVEEFVDPKLGDAYSADEVSTMIEIAARCVADTPALRPSMAEIVKTMTDKVSIIAPKGKPEA